jgi:hypothetical protein
MAQKLATKLNQILYKVKKKPPLIKLKLLKVWTSRSQMPMKFLQQLMTLVFCKLHQK